tara:strand:+ start:1605 stop:1997 length:393 start_codon:yes stop_codon:yes gene_type:complete
MILKVLFKVVLVIIAFFALMYSIEVNAQSFTVNKDKSNYTINFIDEYNDLYYLNGEKVVIKAELTLTEKDYKQLIKDIKKTLRFDEYEIDRKNYAVIKYAWVRDSIWVYFDEKAFSVIKSDLEYLNNKLK